MAGWLDAWMMGIMGMMEMMMEMGNFSFECGVGF
jgi:hypothetical protein